VEGGGEGARERPGSGEGGAKGVKECNDEMEAGRAILLLHACMPEQRRSFRVKLCRELLENRLRIMRVWVDEIASFHRANDFGQRWAVADPVPVAMDQLNKRLIILGFMVHRAGNAQHFGDRPATVATVPISKGTRVAFGFFGAVPTVP